MPIWSVNLNPKRLCPRREPAPLARRTEAAFHWLADLGAGGVRLDVDWTWLEPARGRPCAEAWRWYDGFLEQAARQGLQVYGVLYHPPAWAQALWRESPAEFLGAWEAWVRHVAGRWAEAFTVAQAWNEPNNYMAGTKGDATLFITRRFGRVEVPVDVPWEALAALFRVTRAAFPPTVSIAFNPLANLLPPVPSWAGWLDWLPFSDRLLAEAGSAIDVVAVDHYPDTWHPGTGPLEWSCLEVAARRIAEPGSPWHGKGLSVGELGYASAPGPGALGPLARWFAGPRDEGRMAGWYAAALPHVARRLDALPGAARRCPWLNVYELFDAPVPHPGRGLLALEDHFGLVRRDGTPKAAAAVLRAVARGEPLSEHAPVPSRLPLYWRVGAWACAAEARWRAVGGAGAG